MNTKHLLAVSLALGGLTLAGGCKTGKDEPGKTTTVAPKAKDMTHYLTADQPYYMSRGSAPAGTLKKGTKFLLVMPQGDWSEIEMADGKKAYMSLAGIEPMAAPAPAKPPMKPMTKPAVSMVMTTTKPTMSAKPAMTPTPAGDLVAATSKPALWKDATHTLTADQPYYAGFPTAGAAPAGTLPKGTAVLVMVPGTNAQVTTQDGKTVYTPTAGLAPVGK
jgi:hypothetical protein